MSKLVSMARLITLMIMFRFVFHLKSMDIIVSCKDSTTINAGKMLKLMDCCLSGFCRHRHIMSKLVSMARLITLMIMFRFVFHLKSMDIIVSCKDSTTINAGKMLKLMDCCLSGFCRHRHIMSKLVSMACLITLMIMFRFVFPLKSMNIIVSCKDSTTSWQNVKVEN